ncbi:hypothetical protein J4032_28210 [Streptomyces formicae]|uniref:Secreted protein n=2 Tax=Streptomyces formicae TaxID=1616117 RepID=A0ABY3WYW8_9ACTN|nr:SCO2322 family protein [Streptomyces formicae]UNM16766.1 hypothetical protein J4032_28210 [Streptomyces formicae]
MTLLSVASPAQAAGYRYWSFWQADAGGGSWGYATQGPATARPADGEVNGFRFAVSTDSADSTRPRTAPDFAALCADTPAKPGTKRIGVVIDFGTPADAPEGEAPPAPEQRTACAQVDPAASSAEALAAVAKPLRYNSDALLCAIAGYPESDCGEQISAAEPTAAQSPSPASDTPGTHSGQNAQNAQGGPDTDGGPSLGLLAGVAAVLALGGAAFLQSRSRSRRRRG